MAAASDSVLHFFGNGKGESFVLESPHGWGVIDCFIYEGRVPVLEFLKAHGVERLRFLSLTHPHDDHFSGLDQMVDHFLRKGGIDEFWRYPTLDVSQLLPILSARAQVLPAPFAQRKQQTLTGLQQAYGMLLPAIKKGRTELKPALQGLRLMTSPDLALKLTAIAPPGKMISEAEQYLADCFQARTAKKSLPDWDLNRISLGFLLEISNHEIVLGGDVPDVSWKAIFASSSCPNFKSTILKVAHHGSMKDNSDKIHARLRGAATSRLAIVTRYSSSRLPRSEALSLLNKHFDRVIVLGEAKGPHPRKISTNPTLKRKFTAQVLSVPLGVTDIGNLQPVSC